MKPKVLVYDVNFEIQHEISLFWAKVGVHFFLDFNEILVVKIFFLKQHEDNPMHFVCTENKEA